MWACACNLSTQNETGGLHQLNVSLSYIVSCRQRLHNENSSQQKIAGGRGNGKLPELSWRQEVSEQNLTDFHLMLISQTIIYTSYVFFLLSTVLN